MISKVIYTLLKSIYTTPAHNIRGLCINGGYFSVILLQVTCYTSRWRQEIVFMIESKHTDSLCNETMDRLYE